VFADQETGRPAEARVDARAPRRLGFHRHLFSLFQTRLLGQYERQSDWQEPTPCRLRGHPDQFVGLGASPPHHSRGQSVGAIIDSCQDYIAKVGVSAAVLSNIDDQAHGPARVRDADRIVEKSIPLAAERTVHGGKVDEHDRRDAGCLARKQ